LNDVASCLTIRQGLHTVLYADDILTIAPSLTELQILVNMCETELCSLDMLINARKSACMRLGYNVTCSSIVAGNQNLPGLIQKDIWESISLVQESLYVL